MSAGRTFVTNGPLLTLTVAERDPGSVHVIPTDGKMLRVCAEVRSMTPVDQLEILSNGRILAAKEASGNRQAALLDIETNVTESGWLAARCWSRERLLDGQVVFAHTSPVYCLVEGRPLRPTLETAAPLLTILDQTREWISRDARCPTEQQREHLLGVIADARQELTRRMQA